MAETEMQVRRRLVEQLTRSTHGELASYARLAAQAAEQEPMFTAHLIAWNHLKGSIRDAKVALPVGTIYPFGMEVQLYENSLAHMASLDPRNFVRALDLAKQLKIPGQQRALRRLAERYLRYRERSFGLWERAVVQHRASMKTLYARWHIKPGGDGATSIFQDSLFGGKPPRGSTLDVIRQLPTMNPREALGYTLERKIPFLVLIGALGSKLKDPDTMLAVIQSMSASELATNMKLLERFGVQQHPALRSSLREQMAKATADAPTDTLLKMSKAAAAVSDSALKQTATQVQERQLAKAKIEGVWAVFGDRSGSMEVGIEASRDVAGFIAKQAQEAHLIFYNSYPEYHNVSGKTLAEIKARTLLVKPSGGTQVFCALDMLRERKVAVNGIVIVSDGEDGTGPNFVRSYRLYCAAYGIEPTVYFLRVGRAPDYLSPVLSLEGVLTEQIDLRGGYDDYSLPNLLSVLKSSRWGLLDEIMETPLKTLDEVFS